MKHLLTVLLALIWVQGNLHAAEDVFEVRATAVNGIFYRAGNIEKEKGGSQIVYEVNLPAKTVTRRAVYNALPKDVGDYQ